MVYLVATCVATLGYSRASWVRFTNNECADTLGACLAQAFVYFGGVPQHVLFDNASTIVVERDAYGPGRHRWHSQMLALADTYGFTRDCAGHIVPRPRARSSALTDT